MPAATAPAMAGLTVGLLIWGVGLPPWLDFSLGIVSWISAAFVRVRLPDAWSRVMPVTATCAGRWNSGATTCVTNRLTARQRRTGPDGSRALRMALPTPDYDSARAISAEGSSVQ